MTAPSLPPHRKALLAATLLLGAALACKQPSRGPQPEQAPETPAPTQSAVQRTLLYPGGDDMLLTAFAVSMPESGGPQQAMADLVRRYLAGPVGPGQVQPFPEHAALRALFLLDGGQVVLDLGGPVSEGGGSDTETARVYGLVDTLSWNFPEVKAVKILVGGQEVDTLLGHLDLSHPLPPEPGMLEASLRAEAEGGVGR